MSGTEATAKKLVSGFVTHQANQDAKNKGAQTSNSGGTHSNAEATSINSHDNFNNQTFCSCKQSVSLNESNTPQQQQQISINGNASVPLHTPISNGQSSLQQRQHTQQMQPIVIEFKHSFEQPNNVIQPESPQKYQAPSHKPVATEATATMATVKAISDTSTISNALPNSKQNGQEQMDGEHLHVQSVLADLTNDSISHVLKVIEKATYDQQQIEAAVQLIKTDSLKTTLPICHMPGDSRPYIQVYANNVKRHPLLDSGAEVTVISYEHESELDVFKARIEPCSLMITTLNSAQHGITGVMWLTYQVGEFVAKIPTIVMKSHKSYFIAGIDFWKAFEVQLSWGKSESLSTTKPWPENKPNKFAEHMGNAPEEKELSVNSTTQQVPVRVGMISTNKYRQRANKHYRDHLLYKNQCVVNLSTPVPEYNNNNTYQMAIKHAIAKNAIANIQRLQQGQRPAVTSYNADLNHVIGSAEIQKIDVQTKPELKTAEMSPVALVMQLLKGMPQKRAQVQEISMEPEIRTAAGANDSYEDVRHKKHTCVTEPHELTSEQHRLLDKVRAEFPYTPESGPLNCTSLHEQRIDTGNAAPEMRKQYPMSPYILAEVHKELQVLIERDIIEPIDYSPWRWPILYVKKKDGGGRICLDARGLNRITVRDAYPTLNVDSVLHNLPKAKYITCLDMTQAFHQITIAPEDRAKTAFAVGHRFFQFKRATMGFTNSPADLAKVLDKVFADLMPKVYHYVDDFIIVSATFEEHIKLLREVAKRMRGANLSISRKKSLFCHKKITFLGYVLMNDGLTPNPERLKPILEYKRPTTVKELKRLIGLIGWYRRFIENAAGILAPLTEMTKGDKKRKIEWTEEAERAFEQIKQALISAPILASPDYSLPYTIYTDASLVAGAAVLTQVHDGIEKVIAYHSCKFSRTQQNYSATERECLAVLSGVEKFRPFIDGVPFTVITDHASLKWLQNLKEPHGKLARWAVRLQAFKITFIHRPGKQMVVPDALSRSMDMIELEGLTKTDDKWYNEMFAFAQTGKAKKYKISNDMLYHMGRFDIRTGERRWTLCVPKEKINEVLVEQHDETHFGYWKTLRSAQRIYYWPNMHRTIYDYVGQCQECKQIKASNEKTRVPTGEYIDPKWPGRVLSLDLVGPLPASKIHKHIWIIVAVDVFSRYTFAKACTRATANVITEFLEKEIFYRFDTPELLITDNGTQFTSNLFSKFVDEHRIRHMLVPYYHPQSNPVEATNKSIKTLLRGELLKRAEHTDWSSVLPRTIMNLNTKPRMPTGFSPHYLLFGREKSKTGNEHMVIGDENEYLEGNDKEDALGLIYEQAAEEQRAMFEKNKAHYNLRAAPRSFSKGDLVYVKETKLSNAAEGYAQKLAPLRKILYIREKETGASDIYILEDAQGKEAGRYHASQIYTK